MSTVKKDKTKTIELGIIDRLTLPGILPEKGGLVEQITAKDIRKKVEFSQADTKLYEMEDIINPDGSTGVKFNLGKDKSVAVKFSDEEMRLILRAITQLDKQKGITQHNLETILKLKNA